MVVPEMDRAQACPVYPLYLVYLWMATADVELRIASLVASQVLSLISHRVPQVISTPLMVPTHALGLCSPPRPIVACSRT